MIICGERGTISWKAKTKNAGSGAATLEYLPSARTEKMKKSSDRYSQFSVGKSQGNKLSPLGGLPFRL